MIRKSDDVASSLARFLAMCYNNRSIFEKGRDVIPEVIELSRRLLERTQLPSLTRFSALLLTRSARTPVFGGHIDSDILRADEYAERVIDALFTGMVGAPGALFLLSASEWRMRNKAIAAAGLIRDDRLRIALTQCVSCEIQIGYGYHEPDPIFLHYETRRIRVGAERRSAVRTRPVVICRHCARRRMQRDDNFVDRVVQAARNVLGREAANDDLLLRATLLALRDDRTFDMYIHLANCHVFTTSNPSFHEFTAHMTGSKYDDDNDCLRRIGDDADRYISAYRNFLYERYAHFLEEHKTIYERTQKKSRKRK